MPTKPTALGFIAAFEMLLDFLGQEAFGVIDLALFHSGPPRDIIHEVFGRAKRNVTLAKKNHSNRAKAGRIAHKLHAYMLEDTNAGAALEGLDLYGYFAKHYYPDTLAGDAEADKVWKYLSRKFTASLTGKVQTCVCGAGNRNDFLLPLRNYLNPIKGQEDGQRTCKSFAILS